MKRKTLEGQRNQVRIYQEREGVMFMETIMEKAERIVATILEALEDEPDTTSVVDEAVVSNIKSEEHHESVAVCW